MGEAVDVAVMIDGVLREGYIARNEPPIPCVVSICYETNVFRAVYSLHDGIVTVRRPEHTLRRAVGDGDPDALAVTLLYEIAEMTKPGPSDGT